MIIGGLQKFSLLDYPEHLSAIIFTFGCNFRCQYCYNPMLVRPKSVDKLSDKPQNGEGEGGSQNISEDDLFSFLASRKGKLDAVVITGGEPTLHKDLPNFIKRIRDMGFKVKLDTNGTNPDMIEELYAERFLDYCAMDLKASPERYDLVTGVQPDLEKIKKSITIIKESGLPYEFRTTMVPGLVGESDIQGIGELIKPAHKWYLQKFISDADLVNSSFRNVRSFTDKEMEHFCSLARQYADDCGFR